MKKLPLIALVALALPVAAQAQDADASANNFAGSYAGITLSHKNITNVFTTTTDITEIGVKGRGPGFVFGYNEPIGDHFILGGEANANDFFARKVRKTLDGGGKITYNPSISYGATAHAGVVLLPTVMAYGLVGYQRMKADLITAKPAVGTTPASETKVSKTMSGTSYGGGLEWALSSRSFLRGEYRYEDGKGKDHGSAITLGFGLRF